jgi:hypothetical protein
MGGTVKKHPNPAYLGISAFPVITDKLGNLK